MGSPRHARPGDRLRTPLERAHRDRGPAVCSLAGCGLQQVLRLAHGLRQGERTQPLGSSRLLAGRAGEAVDYRFPRPLPAGRLSVRKANHGPIGRDRIDGWWKQSPRLDSRHRALVGTSRKESSKDEASFYELRFVPRAGSAHRSRRQWSAMNSLRSPLTPLPARKKYSCPLTGPTPLQMKIPAKVIKEV